MPLEQTIPAEEMPEQISGTMAELLALSCAPVFAQMLPIIRQSIENHFDTESSPDGSPWPPRKNIGDGHPLLVETGAMAAAAIGQGTGAMEQLSDRELLVGVEGEVIPYAAAQNYGYPDNNLPQREYFAPDDQAIDECQELLADYVERKIFGENG